MDIIQITFKISNKMRIKLLIVFFVFFAIIKAETPDFRLMKNLNPNPNDSIFQSKTTELNSDNKTTNKKTISSRIQNINQATVTDIDGNIYHTINIGTQTWMIENLRVTKFRNGDLIPKVTDNIIWAGLSTPGYCWYNNDISNKTIYGAMYNWFTVADNRNITPIGWHVPTDNDFTLLTDFLNGESQAGGKMKEAGTINWNSPNSGATNESGFTGLPGGLRDYSNGSFRNMGSNGYFWTSLQSDNQRAWDRELFSNQVNCFRYFFDSKLYGFSIRCVKDTMINAVCPPISDTKICCSGDLIITLTAPDNYTTYSWTNQNGTPIGTTKLIQINNPADNDVFYCSMTSPTGCTTKFDITILKYNSKADFSTKIISDCISSSVQFTNLSTTNRGVLTYNWDFGDGTSSTETNPIHKYATSTTQQVTLIVSNPGTTCTQSYTKTVESFPVTITKADFSSELVSDCISSSIKFTNLSTTNIGILTYKWSFGDGTSSSEVNPIHTFASPGNKQVTLVVDNSSTTCTQSFTKTVETVSIFPKLPLVEFTVSPTILKDPQNEVTCNISPEADVTYSWELGDGTTETGSTIKHAYQLTIKDFQYKITLTATNKNGCVKTGSKNIEVNPLIPNVFSPNGDGIDDIFMKGVDLQIFDRLVIILYNGNTGWDGTYHGQQVKVDTYFYYIKLNDNDQNQRTFKGYLTLIR